MSVDKTIEELSGTLAQLGQLVGHINLQIGGVTGRLNQTLDNFDKALQTIAQDASSVTGQVGDTVSQVPNSWVFYMLFITLIVVFILLSVVLLLNLFTKLHAIYVILKTSEDGAEKALISERRLSNDYPYEQAGNGKYDPNRFDQKFPQTVQLPAPPPSSQTSYAPRAHVAIPMDHEPRRVGRRAVLLSPSAVFGQYVLKEARVPVGWSESESVCGSSNGSAASPGSDCSESSEREESGDGSDGRDAHSVSSSYSRRCRNVSAMLASILSWPVAGDEGVDEAPTSDMSPVHRPVNHPCLSAVPPPPTSRDRTECLQWESDITEASVGVVSAMPAVSLPADPRPYARRGDEGRYNLHTGETTYPRAMKAQDV